MQRKLTFEPYMGCRYCNTSVPEHAWFLHNLRLLLCQCLIIGTVCADLDHPVAPEGYNSEQDTEKMIKFHLSAMDRQLVQMYRAMAIAVIMNRTLVRTFQVLHIRHPFIEPPNRMKWTYCGIISTFNIHMFNAALSCLTPRQYTAVDDEAWHERPSSYSI